ncbi:membrane-associated oxidoreductase [Streptomyces sp. 891-h]|uniref:membrane-associated oxidoreductase n=1 Tax=Streptomyces sp. 891-h TaxID=2720714 RepID=UPI001FAAB8F1|nr:membrane-associated oxidoreductase [Streptomyces sp. 891-h]UNZ16357.1 membrane-associated oxidoreductase [Streptomyces sp. 891-h]
MEITELTEPERRVWEAFPRGEPVDLSAADERTVRARVLRSLLLTAPDENGEIPALRLRGARVTGELNVHSGHVSCPVSLRDCDFDETVVLYGAEFRQLTLGGCRMPGLWATTLRVDGALRLNDCRVTGAVALSGARIAGALFLDRAEVGVPAEAAGDDGTQPAERPESPLKLDHATVGEDLRATRLTVHGRARLDGVTVTGLVRLDDARLLQPGGTALQAETLTVGTDLHAMRLWAEGRVNLRGATVPGQLNLSYARLSNPGGVALRASSCTAGEFWLREARPVEGVVNLRRGRFELLHISPEVWPAAVQLDGLMYTTLVPARPAAERLEVLTRDADGYIPFAYEQLTAAYRHIGDDAAARTVQLAKQRRHRTTLALHGRLWGYLQDVTVGYGFRPMRAAGWLAGLLLVGAVTYGLRPPRPLKADEAPGFNAFAYALDLLLPIIDFGQEKAYAPQGGYQWLAYLLIVAGWVLATTFVTGVNRAVSRY